MNRREILKYTAFATGAAVSAPLLSILLSGCQSESLPNATETNYQLQFFNSEEFEMVKDLADLILPKTDSPSATAVGVHRTMDMMIGGVYNQEDRQKYKKGFLSLFIHLNTAGYLSLDKNKKLNLLKKLRNEEDETLKEAQKAFLDFKQQTVAYYLSTEEIATKHLIYLPVPGKYEACITVEEMGGKAWAL